MKARDPDITEADEGITAELLCIIGYEVSSSGTTKVEINASLTKVGRTAGKTSEIEGKAVVENLNNSTVAVRDSPALTSGTVEQATG